MFERKKTSCGLKVPQQYARRSHSNQNQNILSTQRKKREVRLPSCQFKGSDPGYRKDYVCIKIGFAVEHTEHRNMVKLEHFQETDLAFLCRCAQL